MRVGKKAYAINPFGNQYNDPKLRDSTSSSKSEHKKGGNYMCNEVKVKKSVQDGGHGGNEKAVVPHSEGGAKQTGITWSNTEGVTD